MKSLCFIFLVTMMMVSTAAAQKLEISITGPDTFQLAWEAIPGQTYHVVTTTDLDAGVGVGIAPSDLPDIPEIIPMPEKTQNINLLNPEFEKSNSR